MKKAKLFLSAFSAFVTLCAFAQDREVYGVITDASSGEGVPFASVMVSGTMNGVSSDADGIYSINAPSDAVLKFSAIGYEELEVEINGRTEVNVEMTPDTEVLEETVVIGYGSAKSVEHLVGSVQTVNSETLKNAPSSSALDQLQGQVAGLQVLTMSGVAGDNAVSMTLHGVGSLNSSTTPLYVIDGIPSSSRAIMAMNPNDIESISILKDAAATSIYGSRAANGVVYVTTKAGSYNEDASVTVRSQYGISTLASMKLYNNMMSGSELMDFWVRSGLHSESWVKTNYIDKGFTHDTKWYEYFMNVVTPQYQNDITIEGGGKTVAYMVSASQYHQEGYTIGNFYDRYTLRSNLQGHPNNWLKFGVNLNLSLDSNQQNGNWGSSADNSNYMAGGLSYLLNPLFPALDENGNVYEDYFPDLGMMNPNYYIENMPDVTDRYGVNGSAYVEIEPVKNLKFVSRAGIDGSISLRNASSSATMAGDFGSTSVVLKDSYINYTATVTNTLEYSMDIDVNNRFSVLLGQEGIINDYSLFEAYAEGYTDDRTQILQNGQQSTYSVYEESTQSKFLSFFGHADYSLFDKYYADVTVRNDASSRFGSAVRNATFWSAGLRWNIRREPFMASQGWINSLDLKASYGTQGNAEIGDYESLGLVGASGSYQDNSGLAVIQPANNQLTWEQQALLTVGLSGRVFDRVDFAFEFYDRTTSSMLMEVPNPYTTGFDEVMQNVGSMSNRGIDITLGVDILRGSDHFLRFNTTFNYNHSKILELFDGRQRWEIAGTGVAYVVGQPVSLYYPIYAGVDPTDGQPMWYLPGEDKDVTTMDPERVTKTFNEDELIQNTGKQRFAPITGGFTLAGGWRGLSVQADFSYVLGKNMINNDAFFYANPNTAPTENQNKDVADFWTPDNTDAKYPDWSSGVQMQFDSHLIEDASFLRLKNLQIGYSLPESLLAWSNGVLKGFRITVTGRNLLTFTKYSGIDPELNRNIALGVAGNSKQVLGGIEITF